jgi:hypothetical protein
MPPVRFHDKFFDVDWPLLSLEAQAALRKLLIRLQHNPLDPGVYSQAQEENEVYAYRFSSGWIVCWRLVRDDSPPSIVHDNVTHIDVLAVEPEKQRT